MRVLVEYYDRDERTRFVVIEMAEPIDPAVIPFRVRAKVGRRFDRMRKFTVLPPDERREPVCDRCQEPCSQSPCDMCRFAMAEEEAEYHGAQISRAVKRMSNPQTKE